MTLREIIQNRKSTYPKDYIEKEIDDPTLHMLLHYADFAPNHKKTKPWRFKIFKGEEKALLAKEMGRLYQSSTPPQLYLEKKHQDILHKIQKSGAIITICIEFSNLVPEWEEIAATAMAVQNMYLLCTELSIGCYWSSPKFAAQLDAFLHLTQNQKCYGLFYLGHQG